MLMHLFPYINKVFSLFTLQERRFFNHVEEDKFVASFNIAKPKPCPANSCNKGHSFGQGRGVKAYSYCQKYVYTIEFYFKKLGLPPYLKKSSINQVQAFADINADVQ